MIKTGHIYIRECDTLTKSEDTYSNFYLLDEDKQVIDAVDCVHIDGKVNIDIEGGVIRIYPALVDDGVYYVSETRTIRDKNN